MALFFPLNVSNIFNPPYNTGYELEHCVQADPGPRQTPIRCYGPNPRPGSNAIFGGQFLAVYFQDGKNDQVTNRGQTVKAWVDPTTDLYTTFNFLLPVAMSYVNSNAAFLAGFETAWVHMVTAGYSLDGKGTGKLGSLTSINC